VHKRVLKHALTSERSASSDAEPLHSHTIAAHMPAHSLIGFAKKPESE